jgi:hypothetical protein
MPFGLKTKVEAAAKDPNWFALEKEINLVDALLEEVLGTFTTGEIREYEVERITSLIEQRRKLVESEQKRLKDHQHLISLEQMMGLTQILVDTINEQARKQIPDAYRTDFLTAVNSQLHRILSEPLSLGVRSVKSIN